MRYDIGIGLGGIGYLQRNGQNYQFDPNAGSAPNWWIVATPKTRLVTRQYDSPNSAGAERAVQQDHVSIQIGNVADVEVYAVQEWLPTGFAAEEISDGGTFDAAASRVRWGPFLDSASRTLSYKVRPPDNFAGEIAVAGTLSADGADSLVNGDDAVTFGSSADRRVLVRMEQGRFKIELHGPLNARVSVETSDHLGDAASWQLLTEFRLTEIGQTWTAPEDSGQSPRFYRVVLKEP